MQVWPQTPQPLVAQAQQMPFAVQEGWRTSVSAGEVVGGGAARA